MPYRVKVEKVAEGGIIAVDREVRADQVGDKPQDTKSLEMAVENEWGERTVDIVVVARDEPEHVRRCLLAIHRTVPTWLNFNITVVDNGSEAHTSALLQSLSSIARVLRVDDFAGYLQSMHVAVQETQGEWLVFVDPRVTVAKGWLEAMLFAVTGPRVGLVSPWSSKRIPMPPGATYADAARRIYERAPDSCPQVPMPGRYCFMLRRMALEAVGGFDVEYYGPGGGELADLYMRLSHAKWMAVRASRAWVLDETPGHSDAFEWMRENSGGHDRFKSRWGEHAKREYAVRAAQDGVVESAAAMLKAEPTDMPGLVFCFRELSVCGLTLAADHLCNQMIERGWAATVAYTRTTPDHPLRHHHMRFAPIRTGDAGAHVHALAQLPAGTRLVATTWSTVQDVADACRINPGLVPVYYVQDDERGFLTPSGKPMNDPAKVEETFGQVPNLVANSTWVREMLVGLGHRARRIGIGVDSQMFHPGPKMPGRPRVIAHCRPSTPRRGWSFIVQAVNRAARQCDFEFVAYDEEWDEDALDMPWRGNLGRLSPEEVAREMRGSHVFFGGSVQQGWGMAELEAMASGCVVVSTDNRGIRDYGTDGHDCLLVKHGDAERAAALLVRALTEESLQQTFGRNARRTAERFDWEPISGAWDRYLRRLE